VEVAATIARMREYQENSVQFSKRILDYLDVTFKYQVGSPRSFLLLGGAFSFLELMIVRPDPVKLQKGG
jgi:hypothetical protein